jgi:hypothetical protein
MPHNDYSWFHADNSFIFDLEESHQSFFNWVIISGFISLPHVPVHIGTSEEILSATINYWPCNRLNIQCF